MEFFREAKLSMFSVLDIYLVSKTELNLNFILARKRKLSWMLLQKHLMFSGLGMKLFLCQKVIQKASPSAENLQFVNVGF